MPESSKKSSASSSPDLLAMFADQFSSCHSSSLSFINQSIS
jgi:hypothetical protein